MDEDSDRQFSGAELEERVAEIQAAFRAMGHPLSDKALDRCGRILSGDISYEEAIDEISHDRIPLRLRALAQKQTEVQRQRGPLCMRPEGCAPAAS